MYARYTRMRVGTDATRYRFQGQVSMFGRKNGFIPKLLRRKIPPGQGEPYLWHIKVIDELSSLLEYPDSTLLIDLKPKQNKTNLSLYEVMDVWGYSSHGWTPILLRLSGLFVDEDPAVIDRHDFIRKDNEVDGPIYEFLYLNGSVINGELVGLWTPPSGSPTNTPLLWPGALRYFVQCIRDCTPDILEP